MSKVTTITGEGVSIFQRSQLDQFETSLRRRSASVSWLEPLRRAAIDRFTELGIPTTRDEEWRFTSLAPLDKIAFRLADPADAVRPLPGAIDRAVSGLDGAPRLVFLNGRFAPDLSSMGSLPAGVTASPLAKALESNRKIVESHLGRIAPWGDRAFTALNTAFMEDGAFLHLADETVVEEPILLVLLSGAAEGPAVSHPRILIVAGARSQATIVESYAPLDPSVADGLARADHHLNVGSGRYFTNAVTEIALGDGAVIHHYKLEQESEESFHIAATQARLGLGSVFSSLNVSLGGSLVRNDVGTLLDGEGADCSLDGLFITTGRQHVDNHTIIDHAQPHGTSREMYKGILDGMSKGVFDGKVVVRPDAQKTDSRQVNRNLLLSDGALINTKPQLEIRADDVKCSHAATIGRLDEAALFYLRSRALSLEAARGLLIQAFAGELLAKIESAPLRARLNETITSRLLGEGWRGETP